MKFNPQCVGQKHTLALALSDGYLSLLPLDLSNPSDTVWGREERLLINDPSTICLSVDWSNQLNPSDTPLLAVSLSNGEVALCAVTNSGLQLQSKWFGHTLPYTTVPAEVWIASFDPSNSHLVFSGGDDGLLKQWDSRVFPASNTPVSITAGFEAGVTSICWNKHDAEYLTVGSYDGHIRMFDRRQMKRAVSDFDVENNAGIWRIKYKHNANFYLGENEQGNETTKNEFLVAAMRAGFCVMQYDENRQISAKVRYLEQGTESLAYGVDYINKKGCDLGKREGFVGSCSFYNHLMHVWDYSY